MPLFAIVILALVQGITEFLPVSSSGHLVLAWDAFDRLGFEGIEQEAARRLDLDIATHVGTLLAVCLYFWRDLWSMAQGLMRLMGGKPSRNAVMVWHLILATLPLVGAGYLLHHYAPGWQRNVELVAWANLFFALLLWLGDRVGMTLRRIDHMGWWEALALGLAQVMALIPGTSRSGVTMTAARFLGYEREEAARFSMLMSIPAIIGAGVLAGIDLHESGDLSFGQDAALAAGLSFLFALVAIALMMAWLRRASFQPFVIYRLLLAGLLFWVLYG